MPCWNGHQMCGFCKLPNAAYFEAPYLLLVPVSTLTSTQPSAASYCNALCASSTAMSRGGPGCVPAGTCGRARKRGKAPRRYLHLQPWHSDSELQNETTVANLFGVKVTCGSMSSMGTHSLKTKL